MREPLGGPPRPPGGIPAGNRIMYPDLQGGLHPDPSEAIRANQRIEGDFSRGASGGCGQNPDLIQRRRPR